jgi:pimeloyl-ACP methyl ester carboxylesterase
MERFLRAPHGKTSAGRATYVGVNPATTSPAHVAPTKHRTVEVEGLEIFYREAGDPTDPALLLLHGFPSSSQMFRNLIPQLSDRYRVVAPDYPGFGQSSFPSREEFDYTFERLYEVVLKFADAVALREFSIYIQDYGAPIGLRIAQRHPTRVQAIVTQSGNAYLEGFTPFWDRLFAHAEDRAAHEASVREYLAYDATKWQWTHGTRDPESIAPDTWELDYHYLARPGNKEIQLDLFYDYQFNLDGYPAFQQYFRERKPPVLIVWGKNDEIFGTAGAEAYRRDVPDAELHLLDTGHFALEEDGDFIAQRIRDFLARHVART